MTDLRTVHTSDLSGDERTRIRELLDAAFDGGFDDTDWEHACGGMHAVVWEGPEPVAHASVVQRRLLHAGRALRVGYVEAVGVRPDRQGRGRGAAVMSEVERMIVSAYDLGALSTGDGIEGFYTARGWTCWLGRTLVMSPSGIEPTPDDDGSTLVYVPEGGPELDGAGDLACDWRDGDVW